MTWQQIFTYLGIFFSIYMLGYATFIMVGNIAALWNLYRNHLRRKMHSQLNHQFYFPVSILVPAFNENQTVLSTIDSLLHLEYEIFEIVVIDDGSTDNTAQKVIETYDMKKRQAPIRIQIASEEIKEVYEVTIGKRTITLIRKVNGGNKADAVNAGINVAAYPYFVCMDGDEILQADALKNSAKLFLEEEDVIAVGGLINISNGVVFKDAMPVETRMSKNLVVSMQSLEYNRAFMASRIFSDTFNGNLNVSGGYGLFKKQPVIEIGGYDSNSVGEDMDLVMRLHNHHLSQKKAYSIKYAPDAVCWTQAPFTLKDLAKQRTRWHRGLIQSMWEHRKFFLNPKYGAVSLVSFMYYFFYELLAPFVELIGVLVIAFALFTQSLNTQFAILIAVLYAFFSVLQTLIFYMSRYLLQDYAYYKGDFTWAIFNCIADLFFFRPYLFFVRIYATFTYRKHLHSWSEIQRE